MTGPKYHVVVCSGLCDLVTGPAFSTAEARDDEAKRIWREECDQSQDGVFWLDVSADGEVLTGCYSNKEMGDDEDDEDEDDGFGDGGEDEDEDEDIED